MSIQACSTTVQRSYKPHTSPKLPGSRPNRMHSTLNWTPARQGLNSVRVSECLTAMQRQNSHTGWLGADMSVMLPKRWYRTQWATRAHHTTKVILTLSQVSCLPTAASLATPPAATAMLRMTNRGSMSADRHRPTHDRAPGTCSRLWVMFGFEVHPQV